VREMLLEAGVQVLDGEAVEIHGVGFAGVKGFLGGFGRGTLGFWGETAVKAFVQAAIDEALKLESALAHIKTERRVALMHYSPIEHTCLGERAEIFPYLGCSRLEEPFMRYPVEVVFHGHAHKGTPEGHTQGGIPVFNVAMPLLLGNGSETPYLLYEV
jgi:Icc-related predicted phosphoesterase